MMQYNPVPLTVLCREISDGWTFASHARSRRWAHLPQAASLLGKQATISSPCRTCLCGQEPARLQLVGFPFRGCGISSYSVIP